MTPSDQFSGLIPLCEAADELGRRIYGPGWRPLKQVGCERISGEEIVEAAFRLYAIRRRADDPSSIDLARELLAARERLASNHRFMIICNRADQAIEHVISLLAERCAAGDIAAWHRSIVGVDTLDCNKWCSSNWRSYFIDGEIELDLPLLGDGLHPVVDGRTARCRREIFVRRRDLDGVQGRTPNGELVADNFDSDTHTHLEKMATDAHPPKRPGPQPGTVDRYGEADRELFPEITALTGAQHISVGEAAQRLADGNKVAGKGAADSRARRLADRYRKEVGN
jgi:hypothetical protein